MYLPAFLLMGIFLWMQYQMRRMRRRTLRALDLLLVMVMEEDYCWTHLDAVESTLDLLERLADARGFPRGRIVDAISVLLHRRADLVRQKVRDALMHSTESPGPQA